MAVSEAMMSIMMIFLYLVALSKGQTMDSGDEAALMATRDALENKTKFPPIQCYEGFEYPFQCDGSGRVYSIYLPGLGLKGRLSEEIGNLTKLQYLDLSNNQFNGSIPLSIVNLASLFSLDLSSNQFNGSIPSFIGNFNSLYVLVLSDNQLSGSIPSSIYRLQTIEYLGLSNNQLSGSISGGFGVTFGPPLSLDLSNNYFTGPIFQGDEHPTCYEIAVNCLFGPSLPNGCAPSSQRSEGSCVAFCNATQVGGPCGGSGICSIGTDGPACACNEGYTDEASKYTCKSIYSPPPQLLPPLQSPPQSPPPLPPSPTRRPPPPSPPPRRPPARHPPPHSSPPCYPPPRKSPTRHPPPRSPPLHRPPSRRPPPRRPPPRHPPPRGPPPRHPSPRRPPPCGPPPRRPPPPLPKPPPRAVLSPPLHRPPPPLSFMKP